MKHISDWAFVVLAGFIAFAEGIWNPFWVWNVVPVVVGYALLRRARRKAFRVVPEWAFIAVSCGLSLIAHAAWVFDWGRMASGSSTGGLVFVFLPIYALVAGSLAFGVARLLTRRVAASCR